MDKRTFIKLSSSLMAAPMVSPLLAWADSGKITNWAGNIEYSTENLVSPVSVHEVSDLVLKYDRLKVLGTRHCFNRIADSQYQFLSLAKMDESFQIDKQSNTVRVAGAVRYGQLAEYLNAQGYALHNLASLPHISVAGACTTATHGSGVKNGNLSTAVAALELVTADGQTRILSRQKDPELFQGAVVGLGALGVITKVWLDIQPTYMVRQVVYQNLSFAACLEHLDQIMAAGYSVSLFTDWQNERFSEVWIKSRVVPGEAFTMAPEFFGARAATHNMHPIESLSAENCTEQMGIPGPWQERLPHFRMGFTPSSGKELQSEYFVRHEHAVDAIRAVSKLNQQITPHLFITEIRTIDADNLWMSPCYRKPSVTIHFTWKQEWNAVKAILPKIEQVLEPYDPRPHWGKLFTMSPARLKSRYSKLPDFQKLVASYDPKGKFKNQFLDTYINNT
jgi:alditol oxidase